MNPCLTRRLITVALALGVSALGSLDARAVNVWPDSNPWTLAEALLGRGGITIRSATYLGANGAAGLYSAGPLDIKDGIVMSSGQISGIPNVGQFISSSNGQPGDALCNQLASPYTSQDRARLEIVFDLAPGYNGIQFSYISGTEEFPDYVGSTFNDPVGVFLNGVNVALDDSVPPAPITLNGPFYENFARVIQSPNTQTAFNGSTPLLTNRAPLTGGSVNNVLVVVVCDMSDSSYDTGIFLTALQGCVGTCQGVSWCGDAKLTPGPEQCDDGNNVNGDGCNVGCEVEPGWVCTGVAGARSTCQLGCGNGSIQAPEECDDGNSINNDGCTNSCKLPKCTDDIRNQNETDIDCGGICPDCINGELCLSGSDCQSNYCLNGRCATPNCTDNVKNGAETGVDCGGPCPGCSVGNPCGGHPDCASGLWCINSICRAPTCTDGIKNGTETGVDCGGPTCGACGTGQGCGQASHCVSGVCIGGICQAPTCSDGVKNGTETGTDCGGSTCGPCGTGQGCTQASHCVSGVCTGGICQAPTCSDGVRNGTETAIDCGGGTCGPCGNGSGCGSPTHCISGVCTGGICQAPTCTDGVRNGQETGLDCGGPTCGKCGTGQGCGSATHCLSGVCTGGICQAPTCSDGVKNGTETGTDCGGGACGPCGTGQGCSLASHCVSGVCTGGICQAPTCSDGVRNGQETATDCGGPTCGPCGTGLGCGQASHCISGVCTGGICQAPTCTDGVRNGQETGLDCGGPTCGKCGTGQGCGTAAHCVSGVCTGGICQAPTCSDGVKNGNETGLDCGGPTCGPCGTGQGCGTASHCISGVCTGSICQAPTCSDGVKNGQETGLDCGGPTCGPCGTGQGCGQASHCISGVCTGNICQAPTCTDGVKNGTETGLDCGGSTCGPCGTGQGCTQASHCISGVCIGNICQAPTCSDGVKNGQETGLDCGGPTCGPCGTGQGCGQPSHCISGVCTGNICQAATCTDGVRNGAETAIDCGGPTCGPCADGLGCGQPSHCISGVCTGGLCQVPKCNDGVRNGLETAIDCGGPSCGPCADGLGCGAPSHCISGVCTGNICQVPRCNDGVKNGLETGLDCGGPTCGPCGTGQGCGQPSHCVSGVCTGNICQAPSCTDGVKNGLETATDCGGGTCGPCADGLGCGQPAHCISGVCAAGICQVPRCNDGVKNGLETGLDCGGPVCGQCGTGQGCGLASHCISGVCTGNICQAPACNDNVKNGNETAKDCGGSCPPCGNGNACNIAGDCQSSFCIEGICCNENCGAGNDCRACDLPGKVGICSYLNLPNINDGGVCDGVDQDCDGQTDENFAQTATSCGVGECARTGNLFCANGQVGNTCTPGAPGSEVCDGKDNDCDGSTDAADTTLVRIPCDKQSGVCAGSMRTAAQCVGGAWQPCPNPVYASHAFPHFSTADSCDNRDNDCDGLRDEDHPVESTSCGTGACARTGSRICSNGNIINTCSAGLAAASDTTCNGVDDNCNGQTDEGYVTANTSCGVGACQRNGQAFCINGALVDSCQAGNPTSDNTCNGVDNDCDGSVDEHFPTTATSCGVGECRRTGSISCQGGSAVDSCSPGAPTAEVCDGKDNDCDGLVDGADPDLFLPNCEKQGGVCAGLKKTPSMCVAGAWQACNDAYYVTNRPAYATQDICDAVDTDCDGQVDENFASETTSCGVGECRRSGTTTCSGGVVSDSCVAGGPSAEVCDGKDNDCDGLTDGADGELVLVDCEKQDGACEGLKKTASLCVNGAWQACNDAFYTAQLFPFYSVVDVCDGNDSDCDGTMDEDYAPQAVSCGVGECRRTGTTQCVRGEVEETCTAEQPSAEVCDGKDNDCDGQTDGVDSSLVLPNCEKQSGVCAGVTKAASLCVNGAWQACGDAVYVAARFGQYSLTDLCDGLNNDCDTLTDEDHATVNTTCGTGACARTGQRICQLGAVLDTCMAGPAAASDSNCNNIDDDCDGQTDEQYLPPTTTCGTGGCLRSGLAYCVQGQVYDSCNASTPLGSDINCNGLDDDCDGRVDEDFMAGQLCVVGQGACERTGSYMCTAGGAVCNISAGVPSPEVCDGVDNDCDGSVDEGVVGSICQRKDTAILSAPSAVTAARSASFTFHDPLDASATAFQCSLDGGPWVRCDGGAISYSGLGDGDHSFLVRSVGPDGSVDSTPAFHAWRVDPGQPDTFFAIAPSNPSQSTTASFVFGTTAAAVDTYRCALDPVVVPPPSSAYAPCDAVTRIDDLSEGSHTMWVYVVSATGVADPTPATHTWVIDLSAPETEIAQGPEAITASSSATFAYHSPGEDSIGTYRCRFEGAEWTACDGGEASFEGLSDGEYTFEVIAVDSTGIADPTPASWSWEVDTAAPDTFITIQPDNPSQTPSASFAFASDEREVTYRCAFDLEVAPAPGDAAWQACDQTVSMSDLSAGSHTLHVAAVDAAGQWDPTPASWTWVIDLTAPETVIDSRPPVQTGPNDGAVFGYSSSHEDVYFECRIDAGAWQRCDGGSLALDAATLNIGDHSFSVRACTNTSGLCDPTPAVASWTITTSNCPLDAVAPTLSCPAGGTWECMGGGRAWFDLEPITASDPCGVQDVSDVMPQTYGLGTTPIVRAVQDGNRNRASCVSEVTVVDTTPPIITCGNHVLVQTDPGVCGAVVALEQPEASDTCHNDLVVFNNAPQVFPVGSTTVTWTALDPSGHTASCEVVVTVEDHELSALDCMEERIVDAPADACAWTGSVTATARDNCAVEVSTLSQDRTYPIGEMDVLFTSTDTNNNVSECTTHLVVRDVTPPTVACPTGELDVLGVFAPAATDACEVVARIENVQCDALDADGNELGSLGSSECPVRLDETGALEVNGRLAEPLLRVRFQVVGEDPSGNIGSVDCELVFSADKDNDGVLNEEDNCPAVNNVDQNDLDGDGVGDVCDTCPSLADDQLDSDGNGVGDVCQDLDRDRTLDADDNCPEAFNPDQLDTDGDGIGDSCDPDPWEGLNVTGAGSAACSGGEAPLWWLLGLVLVWLPRRRLT